MKQYEKMHTVLITVSVFLLATVSVWAEPEPEKDSISSAATEEGVETIAIQPADETANETETPIEPCETETPIEPCETETPIKPEANETETETPIKPEAEIAVEAIGLDIVLDGSSLETFDNSLAKIRETSSASEYKTLENSINYLLFYDLAAQRNREKLASRLDGMTGAEVMEKVDHRRRIQ